MNGIINSIDMSLSKLQEIVKDRETRCAAVHGRKGTLLDMQLNGTRQKLYYSIPTRCLFGYRSELLTDTRGEGIISSIFAGYEEFRGEIKTRFTSSLVASETGVATTYGLYQSQDRGPLFIGPATPVYEGMIVGENPKPDDIEVNVCREKHLTAIRSSTHKSWFQNG